MKKWLALFLTLAMVLSFSAVAEEELRVVRILCRNDYSSEVKVENWENYNISDYYKARLADIGLAVELECIDNASFGNVVITRMAAGVELPDVVSVAFDGNVGQGLILDWAEAGLVMPINGLLDLYDDDDSIRTFYNERCPGALGANTAPDGNLYWFSYLVNQQQLDPVTGELNQAYTQNPRTLSIRQDWLEAVGLDVQFSYTPDELIDSLIAIQDGDANGNGLKDEFVNVSIDSFDNAIAVGFGLSHSLLAGYDENNVVESNFRKEEFKDYIKFMQRLYEEGLYDTSAIGAGIMSSELITENKAAITYNYAAWSDYEAQISATDKAQYTPIILDPDGIENGFRVIGDLTTGFYNYHFITSACKDPEAVIDLFDYCYTEEYARLVCAGTENVTYTVTDAGAIKNIQFDTARDPLDPVRATLGHTGLGLYALPNMNVILREYVRSEATGVMEAKLNWKDKYIENVDKVIYLDASLQYAIANEEENEIIGKYAGVLGTYASELLSNLILGRKSLDNLDTYLTEMEELGLSELVEVYQGMRDRYIAASK